MYDKRSTIEILDMAAIELKRMAHQGQILLGMVETMRLLNGIKPTEGRDERGIFDAENCWQVPSIIEDHLRGLREAERKVETAAGIEGRAAARLDAHMAHEADISHGGITAEMNGEPEKLSPEDPRTWGVDVILARLDARMKKARKAKLPFMTVTEEEMYLFNERQRLLLPVRLRAKALPLPPFPKINRIGKPLAFKAENEIRRALAKKAPPKRPKKGKGWMKA